MDRPELAFAILRVIRYWSPGPSRERSVGCSASKRRNSCPCGSVEVERLMIVSSRCARWLPAASEPTRCCQSLPLATTAAALCHHRCNCLPRGKAGADPVCDTVTASPVRSATGAAHHVCGKCASHGARWREQVRKARTPTPYTLYAAALGATARGMLCSHTVLHRFAAASEPFWQILPSSHTILWGVFDTFRSGSSKVTDQRCKVEAFCHL